MIELTDEYKKTARMFREKFGYGVPLNMIPPTTKTDDLIESMERCIASGEDNLLDRYGIKIEDGDIL